MTKTQLISLAIALSATALYTGCAPEPTRDHDDDESTTTSGPGGGEQGGGGQGAGGQGGSGQGGGAQGGSGGSAPMADLIVDGYSIWVDAGEPVWDSQAANYHTVVTICLNSGADYDNYIAVRNVGSAAVDDYFEVGFGVYNETDGNQFWAPNYIYNEADIGPGEMVSFDGSMCTELEVRHLYSDVARVFLYADYREDIVEQNEDNNASLASQTLSFF